MAANQQARQKAIIDALRAGNTRKAAANYAGCHIDTFHEWFNRFPKFSEDVRKAEADAEVRMVTIVAKEAQSGTWQAAAWWLERRRHEDWKKREGQELTGKDGGPIEFAHAATTFDYRITTLLTAGRGDADSLGDPGGGEGTPALPVGALGEAEPAAAAGGLADVADSGGSGVWEDEDGSRARSSGDREWSVPEDGSGSADGG